jgi:hypothetical protein
MTAMRGEPHPLPRGHGGLEAGLAREREVAWTGAARIAIGKGEVDGTRAQFLLDAIGAAHHLVEGAGFGKL